VTDNVGVDEVTLEFAINAVSQAPVLMTRDAGTDTYRGVFTGSAGLGDEIAYRIRATDAAETPNTTYDPATGLHTFTLAQELVEMDAESGEHGWTHESVTLGYVDQWHMSSQRNATVGGAFSWKFGDMGSGSYAITADGALVTPAMTLGSGASMVFHDWLDAEQADANLAYHAAVVELSTDGGAIWELIEPIGGYSHAMVDYPSNPLPAGYPCWSGSHGWRQEEFPLDAFAGETVAIRFRFATDGWPVQREGWYVDDILITPNCVTVDVSPALVAFETQLLGVSPSPFNPTTSIRYELAEATHVVLRIYDTGGRSVRTLMDGMQAGGRHQIRWDGRGDTEARVASGVYWVRMTTSGGHRETGRMVLLK
jgi:hypothetical protein